MKLISYSIVVGLALSGILSGCGSSDPAAVPLTAAEVKGETNPLIKGLESVPPSQRVQYLRDHQSELQELGKDPAAIERLTRLMKNSPGS